MRLILLALLLCFGLSPRLVTAQMAPQAAARVLDATVMLRSADGRDRFLGSGFVFDSTDRVVTNAHVVGKAAQVVAVTRDGTRIDATVLAVDPQRDLAVLVLATPHGTALRPALGVFVGQGVFATGAPLEAAFTLTQGIVSALARQIDPTQPIGYLQHSAAVNPGSSGGPLVDDTGAVLGINTRISDGSRFFVGIAYAVPVADVADFVARGPLAQRPPLGLQLRPLVPRIKAALGYDGTGALVEQVQPDTPADLAGIRAGDILTAVNDHLVTTPGDLAFALAQGGTHLRLTVWRENQALTLAVSLVSARSDITPATPQQVQRRDQYKLTDMGLELDADGTIRAVVNQGTGFFAGLTEGDRIVAINGTAIADLPEGWTRDYTFDKPVLLRISLPDGATRHYLLDPWEDGPALRLASGANVLDKEVVSFD